MTPPRADLPSSRPCSTEVAGPPRALYASDLAALGERLQARGSGPLAELARVLRRRGVSDDDRFAGILAVPRGLAAGDAAGLAAARAAFLAEFEGGAQLDRGIHYWDSPNFLHGDRWICSAMLAQLLICWDWLACAGVWSEAERSTHAERVLSVLEALIEPHLAGRGNAPVSYTHLTLPTTPYV